MSPTALFLVGLFVTAIVSVGLALIAWAAVEDGRYNREQQERNGTEARPSEGAHSRFHVVSAAHPRVASPGFAPDGEPTLLGLDRSEGQRGNDAPVAAAVAE
jgi:hypothetical protein